MGSRCPFLSSDNAPVSVTHIQAQQRARRTTRTCIVDQDVNASRHGVHGLLYACRIGDIQDETGEAACLQAAHRLQPPRRGEDVAALLRKGHAQVPADAALTAAGNQDCLAWRRHGGLGDAKARASEAA